MKQLKIAVCLSGQSRTWKAALAGTLHHFSSDKHEYHFFGHTWNENSWKVLFCGQRDYLHERIDPIKLDREIREAIPIKALKVDPQASYVVNDDYFQWGPMLKSAMLANYMKTQHEIKNDMLFDVVVRTRWDALYDPQLKFDRFLPQHLCPNALYCMSSADFVYEYRLPDIVDTMYFGSSTTMNMVDSIYHYYVNNKLNPLFGNGQRTPVYDRVGPGVLLYKWATHKNLLLQTGHFRTPGVIRKDSEHLLWPRDYEKMRHSYIHFEAV